MGNAKTRSGSKTIPSFLKKKKPPERRVTIVLDQEILDAYEDAVEELALTRRLYGFTARSAQNDVDRAEAQGRIDEAEKAVKKTQRLIEREGTVTFVFRALTPRSRYDDLVRQYPPTDEQVDEHRQLFGLPASFNGETFGPALIAASCVSPEITEEQVKEMIEGTFCDLHGRSKDAISSCRECNDEGMASSWTPAELADLFSAALEVNTQRRTVELGKGLGKILKGEK